MNIHYVYILTNKRNSVFYIGVTNNIERRVLQHKHKTTPGFSEKYNLNKVVFIEEYQSITEAIATEKRLKSWNRAWKIELIRNRNPEFKDLSE